MKKVLIIGGAGYVGSMLTLSLLQKNFYVIVYDLFIYKSVLINNKSKKLRLVKADIRDVDKLSAASKEADVIIHLACISNDPSFELNPKLGQSINLDCFEPYIKSLNQLDNKRFIYASSSSVYGLKSDLNVTEDCSLEPLTDYSKFKAQCEEILLSYNNDSNIKVILRPATVCGYSIRQRLDVVVNIFSNLAYNTKKIKIFGGKQLRPNIHIKDMIRAYELMINADSEVIDKQIFNVGTENISLNGIADKVIKLAKFNLDVENISTDDNRSYHISSNKIKELLNFNFNYFVDDAIKDLFNAFDNNLLIDPLTNEEYFNIKKMNSLNLK